MSKYIVKDANGKTLDEGAEMTDFRGRTATLIGGSRPNSPDRDGKVTFREPNGFERESYARAWNLTVEADPPHSEPIRADAGDRQLSATWDIGSPDEEGQPQAEVYATHHGAPHKVYQVWLRTRRKTATGVVYGCLGVHNGVLLYSTAAGRFSLKQLEEAFEIGISRTRDRYAKSDPEILPYFDASSPVFNE
ncbi:hypothetical protein [Nocardia asiatica]|uniref:hypothetical protein n=1 Tax=Nocardia asiatica TaxID=209252 RepID=UPI002454D609|nr:hypothetical protein [Nocardia asiatica]